METSRLVKIASDHDRPCLVVFEMLGHVIEIPPNSHVTLVLSGPATAALTVGYGRNGVSVFRDRDLQVEVLDAAGERVDVPGF